MVQQSLPVEYVVASEVLARSGTNYPEPFASRMKHRSKRVLGNVFGLKNFGVNMMTLAFGGESALRHAHATQDEFVYILSGTATLVTDTGKHLLRAGMCAGFPEGNGNAHQLRNESEEPMTYLEIGDRSPGDQVTYPDDDIAATLVEGEWQFRRKNGSPF